MKTRIATALSVVGVLGAGSAAALVNTQILDSGPAESSASAAALAPASSVDITIPDTTPDETTSTTEPETTEVDTTMAAPPAAADFTSASTQRNPAPPASGFLTTYNVGDAGVVTLDVVDGRLVLVNAAPKSGWSVSSEESNDDEVDVEFLSTTVRVEFSATFVDGQIVPKVTSKSVSRRSNDSAAPAAAPAPAPDTDDDQYESEDHDEDQYEDESHDEDQYEDESHDEDQYEDENHDEDQYEDESHDDEEERDDD